MGVVYLASEADSDEKIALKVINSKHCDDAEFIKRFHRETKAVGELKTFQHCRQYRLWRIQRPIIFGDGIY